MSHHITEERKNKIVAVLRKHMTNAINELKPGDGQEVVDILACLIVMTSGTLTLETSKEKTITALGEIIEAIKRGEHEESEDL